MMQQRSRVLVHAKRGFFTAKVGYSCYRGHARILFLFYRVQVWRLPLWEGYRKQLSSKIADLKNVGTGG